MTSSRTFLMGYPPTVWSWFEAPTGYGLVVGEQSRCRAQTTRVQNFGSEQEAHFLGFPELIQSASLTRRLRPASWPLTRVRWTLRASGAFAGAIRSVRWCRCFGRTDKESRRWRKLGSDPGIRARIGF